MIKIKLLLVGLAATVAIMAMSAAPAGAWFKSLTAKTQGQVKGQVTTLEAGGAKVSCQSAFGEWHLQSKGKFEEHEINEKQVATTEGPHLYITVLQWNNCKATIASVSVGAKVSSCEFQIEQPQKGVNKGTASLITACVIKTEKPAECEIIVAAGKEVTGENAFLKEVTGENNGSTVLGTANVTGGIHGTSKCEAEPFVNGKFKSGTNGLQAIGINLV